MELSPGEEKILKRSGIPEHKLEEAPNLLTEALKIYSHYVNTTGKTSEEDKKKLEILGPIIRPRLNLALAFSAGLLLKSFSNDSIGKRNVDKLQSLSSWHLERAEIEHELGSALVIDALKSFAKDYDKDPKNTYTWSTYLITPQKRNWANQYARYLISNNFASSNLSINLADTIFNGGVSNEKRANYNKISSELFEKQLQQLTADEITKLKNYLQTEVSKLENIDENSQELKLIKNYSIEINYLTEEQRELGSLKTPPRLKRHAYVDNNGRFESPYPQDSIPNVAHPKDKASEELQKQEILRDYLFKTIPKANLTDNELKILSLSFGLDRTDPLSDKDIAKEMGWSPHKLNVVRRLRKMAIHKLSETIKHDTQSDSSIQVELTPKEKKLKIIDLSAEEFNPPNSELVDKVKKAAKVTTQVKNKDYVNK